MKTTAAVLFGPRKPFEIVELELDGRREGEVLIDYTAAGLCHSDLHLTDGDLVPRFPIVGGHEGAGVIEDIGPGVTKVKPGDHVGSANPQYDIVRLLRLYDAGQLKLDELVTARYGLEEINKGYQDLRDGNNIRGVIIH